MERSTRHMLAALVLLWIQTSAAEAHNGNTQGVAWEVCETATLGDPCEFVDHHDMVNRGTCRSGGSGLHCVRHKPLIHIDDRHQADQGTTYAPLWAGLVVGGLWFVVGWVLYQRRLNPED